MRSIVCLWPPCQKEASVKDLASQGHSVLGVQWRKWRITAKEGRGLKLSEEKSSAQKEEKIHVGGCLSKTWEPRRHWISVPVRWYGIIPRFSIPMPKCIQRVEINGTLPLRIAIPSVIIATVARSYFRMSPFQRINPTYLRPRPELWVKIMNQGRTSKDSAISCQSSITPSRTKSRSTNENSPKKDYRGSIRFKPRQWPGSSWSYSNRQPTVWPTLHLAKDPGHISSVVSQNSQ